MGNELIPIRLCRHCNALISINDEICNFCNENIAYPIPKEIENDSISEIVEKINKALIRMEMFFSAKTNVYKYFGFAGYFEKLFSEMKNAPENYTMENQNILDGYYMLLGQIDFDFDKGRLINDNAYSDKELYDDITELGEIHNDSYRFNLIYSDEFVETPRYTVFDLIKDSTIENESIGKKTEIPKIKYVWKSTHALNKFYKSVNNNFFEELDIDTFFDVFTENSKLKLKTINYNQTDIGYLLDMIKPYFIEKVQANYLDYISEKILFNETEKNKKAVSEILNFHKTKKVNFKESITTIVNELKSFNN